jgi:beta-mannosidase
VRVTPDPLAGAAWECVSVPPDEYAGSEALALADLDWLKATVPGTAAGALRDAGLWRWGVDDEEQLDGRDWWFRCRFAASDPAGPWELRLGGLATVADVWLNGAPLLHSENMFLEHRVPVDALEAENELAIRFAALTPLLARRHPRPRWKSLPVRSQSLRWYRTSFQGRLPDFAPWAAAVGPWQPVTLTRLADGPEVVERRLRCRCEGEGGVVSVDLIVRRVEGAPVDGMLVVGDQRAQVAVEPGAAGVRVRGTVTLDSVERWWPHTHGEQPLYPVSLELGGSVLPLGSVGFRTVEVDQSDGAFTLRVNGVPIFCRGGSWPARDPVTFAGAAAEIEGMLRSVREAGMNMIRVPGYSCYADDAFWDACDGLGILVWQDFMFSTVDPPDDPAFAASVEQELSQVLSALQGRPSLAVTCGGTEMYQQAAMFGLPLDSWRSSLLEETMPAIVAELAPGIPFLPSTPYGGELPFSPDAGTAHYFGVGGFMKPLSDARQAGIRFAAECLAFGTPPEPETIDEAFGGPRVVGHDPRWKATVPRDPGMSWDYEEAGTYYVREFFGLDPLVVRYSDPERALDLTRAAVSEAMTVVLSDWRRRSSACEGALILCLQDWWPGAGWGLVDGLGRPKAPWYAVARVFAPRTIIATNDGLAGLHVHACNDRPTPFSGTLRLTVFDASGQVIESATEEIEVGAHDELALSAQRLLGGFRDLTNAYRFAPVHADAVLAELLDADGTAVAEVTHLPAGAARSVLPDVGLTSSLERASDGSWSLAVTTRLFAQYVAVDIPGFRPSDSWFQLAPGRSKVVTLEPAGGVASPVGTVRALNSLTKTRVSDDG